MIYKKLHDVTVEFAIQALFNKPHTILAEARPVHAAQEIVKLKKFSGELSPIVGACLMVGLVASLLALTMSSQYQEMCGCGQLNALWFVLQ